MSARAVQTLALLALTVLYVFWWHDADLTTLVVFALPPLALAVLVTRWPRLTAFWAGVLALAWFSHGVMVAWSRPTERKMALIEIVLAVVVVFSANYPGLRARFSRRRSQR